MDGCFCVYVVNTTDALLLFFRQRNLGEHTPSRGDRPRGGHALPARRALREQAGFPPPLTAETRVGGRGGMSLSAHLRHWATGLRSREDVSAEGGRAGRGHDFRHKGGSREGAQTLSAEPGPPPRCLLNHQPGSERRGA